MHNLSSRGGKLTTVSVNRNAHEVLQLQHTYSSAKSSSLAAISRKRSSDMNCWQMLQKLWADRQLDGDDGSNYPPNVSIQQVQQFMQKNEPCAHPGSFARIIGCGKPFPQWRSEGSFCNDVQRTRTSIIARLLSFKLYIFQPSSNPTAFCGDEAIDISASRHLKLLDSSVARTFFTAL